MSEVEPVENDIRLIRMKVRKQKMTEEELKAQMDKLEDSASNAEQVKIEEDEFLGI